MFTTQTEAFWPMKCVKVENMEKVKIFLEKTIRHRYYLVLYSNTRRLVFRAVSK